MPIEDSTFVLCYCSWFKIMSFHSIQMVCNVMLLYFFFFATIFPRDSSTCELLFTRPMIVLICPSTSLYRSTLDKILRLKVTAQQSCCRHHSKWFKEYDEQVGAKGVTLDFAQLMCNEFVWAIYRSKRWSFCGEGNFDCIYTLFMDQ